MWDQAAQLRREGFASRSASQIGAVNTGWKTAGKYEEKCRMEDKNGHMEYLLTLSLSLSLARARAQCHDKIDICMQRIVFPFLFLLFLAGLQFAMLLLFGEVTVKATYAVGLPKCR